MNANCPRILLAVGLVLSLLVGGLSRAEAGPSSDLVAVVYDGTTEADCAQSIQIDGGPSEDLVCPAGSVIFALRMTTAEAREIGAVNVVNLTGDEQRDSISVKEMADAVHNAAASPGAGKAAGVRALVLAATCTARAVTLNGSYVNPRAGGRTYYSFSYLSRTNCTTYSGGDSTRTTSSASITWDLSCVDSGYNCYYRGFGLSGSWANGGPIPDSYVGNYYGNYSTCNSGCGISNGVQAFGYQTFV